MFKVFYVYYWLGDKDIVGVFFNDEVFVYYCVDLLGKVSIEIIKWLEI